MAMVTHVGGIFQICGYQNSGKTTLLQSLLQNLGERNIKAAVLKHHGHGGNLTLRDSQKDSERHLQAGAVASLVEGNGALQLLASIGTKDLYTQISILSCFHPDVIFVEGHKHEEYPKILVLKEREHLSLLDELSNIRGVVYWPGMEEDVRQKNRDVKLFPLKGENLASQLTDFILKEIS